MAARIKVRAVIWVGDRVVVDATRRRHDDHVRLPGGRVNQRESVTDALRREVLEEVGLEVEVGRLLCAAEVVSGARIQDVELVFEATPTAPVDGDGLVLIDPAAPGVKVLPPVMDELARQRRAGEQGPGAWLGNIYAASA